MPLFHVHGLMAGLLAPLASGAAVILPAAGRFSASTFWHDAVRAAACHGGVELLQGSNKWLQGGGGARFI